MKKSLSVLFIFMLMSIFLSAQNYTYHGVKLFDFHKQSGFVKSTANGMLSYDAKDIGYFDYVLIIPSQPGIAFDCESPSMMKWEEIYLEIVNLVGRVADKDDDYIPERGIDDKEYQGTLIKIGEARYVRFWYLADKSEPKIPFISLSWKEHTILLISGIIDRSKTYE